AGYVIQHGSLTLTTGDPRSDQAMRFGPGTLIGELALLTETVCSATAVATEPTTVIRISRNLFRKVLEGFPEAARLMRERLAARVSQSHGELLRIRAMLERPPSKSAQVDGSPVKSPLPADRPLPSSPSRGRRWRLVF